MATWAGIVRNRGSSGVSRLIPFAAGQGVLWFGDVFRFTFSGVTVSTACIADIINGPTGQSYKVTGGAGLFNGSYDVPVATPAPGGVNTPLTVSIYLGAVCGTLDSTVTPKAMHDICGGGGFGSEYVPILASTAFSGGAGLFFARVPVCDFRDGVVVNNEITATGPFTDSTGLYNTTAVGSGGTVLVERASCWDGSAF